MKKGDIVQKEVECPSGRVLIRNFDSEEAALTYGKTHFPHAKVQPDDLNTGKFMLVEECKSYLEREGIVNWVIGTEAAIVYDDNSFVVVDLMDDEASKWKVIRQAPEHNIKSQLAEMSDEELLNSLKDLRHARMNISQRRKSVEREVKSTSDLEQALLNMTPEMLAKLKAKLGGA